MLTDGQLLTPRYQITRSLGNGGMGALYEAFDKVLEATVVIKENLLTDESSRLAFHREAKLLANLHHPSLATCIDFFMVGDTQYMVLEFIDGENLDQIMSASKEPLPAGVVLDWARQLLDVVNYLHDEMVLHRDIKPSNIKILDGRLYLLDFGLAYGRCGEMNTIAGNDFDWYGHSPKYSPLEQLRGQRTYVTSDLYSLAATLYRLLTHVPGTKPSRMGAQFRFDCLASRKSDPVKKIERPDLDVAVSQTILKAMSLDMNDRPQSGAEMKRLMFPEPLPPVTKISSPIKFQFAVGHALIGIVLAGILIFASTVSSPKPNIPEEQTQLYKGVTYESANKLGQEAEALWLSGKYEAALIKIKQALVLDSTDVYLHFIHGETLWDLNELTTPVAAMRDVQKQAHEIIRLVPLPRTSKERIARAWAYLALSRTDDALNDVNHALDLDPNSASALLIRAAARVTSVKSGSLKGDESLASVIFSDCKKAIQLAPNYPHAYTIYAEILLATNQTLEARDAFQKAVSLRPQPQASFYHKLGVAYFLLGDLEKASQNHERAVEQNSQYYPAYTALGDLYAKQKDWTRAAENYFLATQIRPSKQGYTKQGDAYFFATQIQAAISSYQKALEYGPTDEVLLRRLTLARARLRASNHTNTE